MLAASLRGRPLCELELRGADLGPATATAVPALISTLSDMNGSLQRLALLQCGLDNRCCSGINSPYLPLPASPAPTCPYLPLPASTCPYLPLPAPTCLYLRPYLPLTPSTCP